MNSNDFLNEDIVTDAHDMHQDHEVQMARQECYHAAERAIAVHKLLRHVNEAEGLEGWVSAKITLANDYLKTVHDYLEYQLMTMNGPAESDVLTIAESQQGVTEAPLRAVNALVGYPKLNKKVAAKGTPGSEEERNKAAAGLKRDRSGLGRRAYTGDQHYDVRREPDVDESTFSDASEQGVAEDFNNTSRLEKLKTLRSIIDDQKSDPQTRQQAQIQFVKLVHSMNVNDENPRTGKHLDMAEDASAGASSSGSVATVVKGGKGGTNLLGGPEYKGPNPFKKKKSK